jgi:hypothetical protein
MYALARFAMAEPVEYNGSVNMNKPRAGAGVTYMRVIGRQYAQLELQRLLLQRQRFLYPPQRAVRSGQHFHGVSCALKMSSSSLHASRSECHQR